MEIGYVIGQQSEVSKTLSGVDNWRASEASETLLVVVQWKTRYVYTYIYIYIYIYIYTYIGT